MGVSGWELAITDVLGLEAVRTLMPEVFSLLQKNAELLAESITSRIGRHEDERGKKLWTRLLEAAGDQRVTAGILISLLFPATNRYSGQIRYDFSEWGSSWRRQRRVAWLDHFSFYLSKVLPTGALRASVVEKIINDFDKPVLLESLRALSATEFSHLIMHIEDYEERFTEEAAEFVLSSLISVGSVLLNQDPNSVDYMFSPDFRLKCIIIKWLRKIESSESRFNLILSIFSKTDTLTWRLELWDIAKNWHNAERGEAPLVDPERTEQLLNMLTNDFMSRLKADYKQVITERQFPRLLAMTFDKKPELATIMQDLARQDDFIVSVIQKSLRTGYVQTVGSTVRRPMFSLPWKSLQEMFGGEFLVERVSYLVNSDRVDAEAKQALTVALEYAEGKRTEETSRERTDNFIDAKSIVNNQEDAAVSDSAAEVVNFDEEEASQ